MLVGITLPFTLTLTVFLQWITRLFLFLLLLLSLSILPNLPFLSAATNAILKPGGALKWKNRLVKDLRLAQQLTEVTKIIRLTSSLPDELCQPSPRLRHGRRLALLSRPNLTLNLCTLSIALSLALLPHLPTLLISPTVPLPGSRLRSSPITRDPTFLSPSQSSCVAEPEATAPSSAGPRVRSLTCPFAASFLQLNFLLLPPNFPPLLLLAQKKLPITC